MKAKLMLLVVVLLLQSCFTYKKLELNQEELITGDRYKLKHVEYGKFKKGRVLSVKDSIITYITSNGKIIELRRDGIQEIKKGKFSLGKTIVLSTTATVGVFGALWLAINGSGLAIGGDWYN